MIKNPFDSKIWIFIFVLVGIAMRLALYVIAPPMGGDQAMLGLNIVNRSFAGLIGGLDYQQVAPIGFLWIERAVFEILGMNELAMLLWPTLVSIAALVLFAYWANILLEPTTAAIATGFLATSNFAVRHGVELKPYGGDLFFSLLLFFFATLYLVQQRDRWLACLIAVTPLTFVISYPAVLSAGAIWLALVTTISRQRKRSAALILVFGIVAALSFLCLVLPVTTRQYVVQTQAVQLSYWQQAFAFPPANPLRFIEWFFWVHTGNMFTYPIEGNAPWCAGNFALFVLGVLCWYRSRRGVFFALLLLPFGTTFLAAAMHRYPYGYSARITQHLVPAIILFTSVGLVDLFRRLRLLQQEKRRRLAYGITFSALLLLGIGELIHTQVIFARGTRPETQVRHFVRHVAHDLGDNPTFIQLDPKEALPLMIHWYVKELNQSILTTPLDQLDLVQRSGPVWVVTTSPGPEQKSASEQLMGRASTLDWVLSIPPGKEKLYKSDVCGFYGFAARPPSTMPAD
jgi:hypothetical protein